MSQYPIHNLNATLVSAHSLATSFNANSTAVIVQETKCLSVQAVWAGTSPVGTLQVTCSNDGVSFSNDPEQASPIAISGNSGSAVIKISNCSYSFVSVSYVSTSGTGTMTVTVSGKSN